jgi:hypothetical protein
VLNSSLSNSLALLTEQRQMPDIDGDEQLAPEPARTPEPEQCQMPFCDTNETFPLDNCAHRLCNACGTGTFTHDPRCPFCRAPVATFNGNQVEDYLRDWGDWEEADDPEDVFPGDSEPIQHCTVCTHEIRPWARTRPNPCGCQVHWNCHEGICVRHPPTEICNVCDTEIRGVSRPCMGSNCRCPVHE